MKNNISVNKDNNNLDIDGKHEFILSSRVGQVSK